MALKALDNPYYDAIKHRIFHCGWGEKNQVHRFPQNWDVQHLNIEDILNREKLVQEYSWAIPSKSVIRRIVEFSPSICEIGAGTGYWAYMLKQAGANVVAYDIAVPGKRENNWGHNRTWYPVQEGDILSINQHQSKALMLCWPPYSRSMASTVLNLYTGNKLIYIGESRYGCTADDKFFDLLDKDWNLVENKEMIVWEGLHDSLYLYER